MAGFAIRHLAGLPYSSIAHGSDLHVDRHMLQQKVADAAFVVAVSEYNRQVIIDECGAWASEKVHVIRCGVATDVFRPRLPEGRTGPFRLLCIGTLHEVKGQHVLIEAARLLRDRGAAVTVTFVRDGPARRDLEHRVRAEDLGDTVHFPGETGRHGVLRPDSWLERTTGRPQAIAARERVLQAYDLDGNTQQLVQLFDPAHAQKPAAQRVSSATAV